MIIVTTNSLYEVRRRDRRFRRLRGPDAPELIPTGQWLPYERMGPVVVGKPLQFFTLKQQRGAVAHIDVVATSPVEDVVVEDGSPSASVG